jgi:hypothetical protein
MVLLYTGFSVLFLYHVVTAVRTFNTTAFVHTVATSVMYTDNDSQTSQI